MRVLVSVFAKGINIANLRKAYHMPNATSSLGNSFHSSARLERGRRGGQSALEPDRRSLSKKQKKRRAAATEKRSLLTDKKQSKIKGEFLKKQFASDGMKEYVNQTDARISESILEMLMPDGFEEDSDHSSQLAVDPHVHIRVLENMCKTQEASNEIAQLGSSESKKLNSTVANLTANGYALMTGEEPMKALSDAVQLNIESNNALGHLLRETGQKGASPALFEQSKQMVGYMHQLKVEVNDDNYGQLINLAAKTGRYEEADLLFDDVLKHNHFADVQVWAAKINNLCRSGRRPEALATLDNLVKLKITPSPAAYNNILNDYVVHGELKEADQFWLRMKDEGVELTVEAFNSMIVKASKGGEVERAFFYYDEMRGYKVEPNELLFANLVRACGKAPSWVNGYQDIIFDALALMEGKEITPTALIYNNIIRAFGKSGDPVAAEYYFWEMRRKGLLPSATTYDALLEALQLAQSVNAPKYSKYGRYAKAPPRVPTDDERAMLNVGAKGVFEIVSSGVMSEAVKFKGKRTKSVTSDLADDPFSERDYIMDLIHMESDRIDQQHAEWKVALAAQKANDKRLLAEKKKSPQQRLEESKKKELMSGLPPSLRSFLSDDNMVSSFEEGESEEDKNAIDFDEMVASDPELQALMKQIHQENPSLLNEVVSTFKAGDLESEMGGLQLKAQGGGSFSETDSDEDDDYDEEEEEEEEDDRSEHEVFTDNKEQLKSELLHARAILKTPNVFSDPFAHVSTSTGNLVAKYKSGLIAKMEEGTPMVPAEKSELAKLLDGALESDEMSSAKDKKELFMERVKEKEVIKPSDSLTKEYLDYKWDVVEFGRAPPPDYSDTLRNRHQQNINRAELALKDMVAQGIMPTSNTLTNMVAVYGSAYRVGEALDVMDYFKREFDLTPVVATYRALAKGHVLRGDIPSAVAIKDKMFEELKFADGSTYSILIESMTQRNMIVEALKLLEEGTERKVSIKERHLKVLRGRCNSLGVRHPDMPLDPKAWVKDMKVMRRNKKEAGERGIHRIKSQLFY